MGQKLPNPIFVPAIEWRARRISDPVERLRFLRRSALLRLPRPSRIVRRAALPAAVFMAIVLLSTRNFSGVLAGGTVPSAVAARNVLDAVEEVPKVWQVEQNREYETFSNGLRIENRFQVSGKPRNYGRIDRRRPDAGFKDWRSDPVGIVYHTTESELAPFESAQNRKLKVLGLSLLEYVRAKQAYNFVIDRFGRVFRVVEAEGTANHAGHSVWADANWIYLNVNASFIGVSFEAQSAPGGGQLAVSPAQIHASRVLTQMLRDRYHIAASNCVTHAQVSVNPDNMRVGYHTDWAGSFPFAEMGLGENYSLALPSMYFFGFNYDPVFVTSTGARLWKGVVQAEQEIRQSALASGLPAAEYQKLLQLRYRKDLAALRSRSAGEENSYESN